MENIKTKKLDIFDTCETRIVDTKHGCSTIIPHVCNNIGLFGSGFAAAVRNKYPVVATNFELLGNKTKLGYVQYVAAKKEDKTGHEIIVANMIAQNGTISKKNTRPLNYEALVRCMINIRNYITENSIRDTIEIHCPRFGSGLAGGNWNFIENLIQDVWYNLEVFIYEPRKK